MRHIWHDPQGRPRFPYFDAREDLPHPYNLGMPAVKTVPPGFGEVSGKLVIVNNPMNQAPWRIVQPPPPPEYLDDGFLELFGPPPESEDFRGDANRSLAFRLARIEYEQARRHYKTSGPPEWATPADIINSNAVFEEWGMQEPLYYTGRYGAMAKWDGFESSALNALRFTHHVISMFQIKVIRNGGAIEKRHPWVPPTLGPKEAALGDAG